jgi:23S rRNA (uracil1939-C5)-methyltransferase
MLALESIMQNSFTARVQAIAQGGKGVLRHDGMVVFVKDVVPLEEVQVELTLQKKSFAEANLLKVIKPSLDRVKPLCEHYSACGGCHFQHISYEAQLEIKKQLISDALQRIAKISLPAIKVVKSPNSWSYRRHIRLKLWPFLDSFRLGFMGKAKDQFVPINRCHIFSDNSALLPKLQALSAKLSSAFIKEARVTILKAADSFVLFFEFEPLMPKDAAAIITEALAEKTFFRGAILADSKQHKIIGDADVELDVLGRKFLARPDAFIQNNPEVSEEIYRELIGNIEALDIKPKILDLYSGIGISSILLKSKGFDVTAVEISEKAVNLAKINGINNQAEVTWISLPAESAIDSLLKDKNLVVMNPPRTGAKPEVLQALLAIMPEHIFYISCMPPTLARDLKILVEGGYKLISVKAFDMFPHTTHVETLVHLSL